MNLIQKKIQQREKTTEIYTVKIKKKKKSLNGNNS